MSQKVHLTKEDLKKPDMFVSTVDKVWDATSSFRKPLMFLLAAVAVGVVGYSIFAWFQSQQEEKAQTAYYEAQSKVQKLTSSVPVEGKEVVAEKKELTPETLEEARKILQGVHTQYPKTKAGWLAKWDEANLLKENKQVELSQAMMEELAGQVSSKTLIGSLIKLQYGDVLHQKNQCDKAVQVWGELLQSQKLGYLYPELLVRQGICFEALKQNDKAVETYKKANKEYPDSEAGRSALKFLRALQSRG